MLMYIQFKKSITTNLFITVHAIEGNFVKGGAEGIFCDRLVCTTIARTLTVNGSCGSRNKANPKCIPFIDPDSA
jgi:hypothetical protein